MAAAAAATSAATLAFVLADQCKILQVVLLSDYGLSAAVPAPSHHHPLKLPDPDPLLVHLSSESAAYWRGLELLAGSPLLSAHHTCDVVVNPASDHAGALGFSKLQV